MSSRSFNPIVCGYSDIYITHQRASDASTSVSTDRDTVFAGVEVGALRNWAVDRFSLVLEADFLLPA